MIKIKSIRLQDYLSLYGYKPCYRKHGSAYYQKDIRIYALLDRYEIKYNIQPNINKSLDYGYID